MKEIAEAYLSEKVTHVIVTVPACRCHSVTLERLTPLLEFNDAQCQATMDAGTITSLSVLRIVNEPTATAIAYGLIKKVNPISSSTISVVVPLMLHLLSIDDGVFEVLATAGDTHLGGEDFDNRLVMDHLIKCYKKTGSDVTKNLRALGKLKREVEKTKRMLSSQ